MKRNIIYIVLKTYYDYLIDGEMKTLYNICRKSLLVNNDC